MQEMLLETSFGHQCFIVLTVISLFKVAGEENGPGENQPVVPNGHAEEEEVVNDPEAQPDAEEDEDGDDEDDDEEDEAAEDGEEANNGAQGTFSFTGTRAMDAHPEEHRGLTLSVASPHR